MMKNKSSYLTFLHTIILILFLSLTTTKGDPRSQTVKMECSTQLETNRTIFISNFVTTMQKISVEMETTGYGVAVSGSGPDISYGLAQCYGDLSLMDCVLCYGQARTLLPNCFPQNGACLYLDGCFMRAENYSFYKEYTRPEDTIVCGNTTQKGSMFVESVRQVVNMAVMNAPNNQGYARAQGAVGSTNESVYVLANCWKSLNSSACSLCLENATKSIAGCFPWSEGRALNTGCFMRYSDIDFLNKVAGDSSSRDNVRVIIIPAVCSAVVLVIGAVLGVYIWKRRYVQKRRREGSNDAEKLAKTLHDSSLNFKYSTLEKATGSFDISNKLGQGGFGTVYKGVLQDGREIAVKRLFFNNKQRAADFYNEVNIISSVEHKNLVRLLGCSCSGPESLLVYEFLPNMSLDRFIFDSDKGKALSWQTRSDIIIGTAEGLVYLHENSTNRILHRDIKASNILLDSKLRAKIADFGLARSFEEDKSHISTVIAGTLGYMAPEYLAHGQLTEKADVYSFGVLLLETVCGVQNNQSKTSEYLDSLITIMWRHFQSGTVEELYDPNLMLHSNPNRNIKQEVFRVVQIALLCTQENPSLRPTMSKALQMLINKEGGGEDLPAPTTPPFIDEPTMEFNEMCEDPLCPGGTTDSSSSAATMAHSSFYAR